MPDVIFKNTCKIYGKSVLAVESLNFQINDKEFFSILGPSGCGKSSTLRMIAGLEEVTSGDIYFGDTRITDFPPAKRNIALAFENYALYPYLNVYQNIAFPLKIRKIPQKEIDKQVREVAEFMSLTGILKTNVNSLSGGQQQRVGVARALIRKPAVFLLDEPISHLEAKLKESMRRELRRIHDDTQITTIYVTHDQEEAISMSDRICIMDKGKVQQVGKPKDIYDNPKNEFVASFVGEPPMNIFNASILSKDGCLKLEIFGENINFPDQYMPVLKGVKGELRIRKVRLGIRSEGIRCFKTKEKDSLIEGEVYFIEPRGKGKVLLNVKIRDFHILVKTDRIFNPELKTKIYLQLIEDKICLFDQDSGINFNRTAGGKRNV